MKGYWLILGTPVTDEAAQKEYGALWAPIAGRYGARLVREQDAVEAREVRDATRVLLVEFPTFEAAKACYDDPAYGEAREHALAAAERSLVLLRGEIA